MLGPKTSQRVNRYVIACIFGLYAFSLIALARLLAHAIAQGWLARFITMALVAVGLLPWNKWLAPRVAYLLNIAGRAIMIVCYFIFMAPFSLFLRFRPDPLARGHAGTRAGWAKRENVLPTLERARVEW